MLEPEKIIYLDHNATTRLDPAVFEEMQPFLTTYYGNPSSGYRFGSQVRAAISLARERVARLLDCDPEEIIFTSGGTESNNAAVNSALQLDPARQHIVTTAVEHSATMRYCEGLTTRGAAVTFLEVNRAGELDLGTLENAIRPDTVLISAMWANNETGVLFPIEMIAEIARRKRVLFHTDAVQAIGKVPVSLRGTAINFCSLSGHKFHGPKGVGALFVHRRSAFRPLLIGGGQEENRRGGTENVASIVGLGKAAELAAGAIASDGERVRGLRDRFEHALVAEVPGTIVNGAGAVRLPNTASLSFAGIHSDAALVMLDQQGVCCSAGSACHTGSLQPSHVLRAMGLNDDRVRGSLRFSLGRFTSVEEIDRAITLVRSALEKLRRLQAPALAH